MSREWDRANMKSLGTNLKKEDAEAFRAYAAAHGTTVGALLRGFVQATITGDNRALEDACRLEGLPHAVSYKNTDRLKHETAFYNPLGLDPNGVLNAILDEYFTFVEKARRRTDRK